MIKIQKLIHDYIKRDDEGNVAGTQRAIDGVDLNVEAGQFIAILGHNGSGKSTLAKHINALLFPTEGTVWVDGLDTKDEKNLWEIRREAGMVFQNPDNQIIAQVVEEDVGFGPENIGVPTEEIWKRVEESLKTVGMWEHRKKSPNRLSGGQKQRVSIAGVIAMEPKCIVLDEPTAMLDPNGRQEVISAAMKLNRTKGITVILITHYMEEAIGADVIFVMDRGKIAMQGSPREIFGQVERMKELQLDVPQVTLLAHELRLKGLKLPDSILTKEELAAALLGEQAGQNSDRQADHRASLCRLNLLGTYVKRRCNLRLIQKESGMIYADDLLMTVRDIVQAMKTAGMQAALRWDCEKKYTSEYPFRVCDTLEYLIENGFTENAVTEIAVGNKKTVITILQRDGDTVTVSEREYIGAQRKDCVISGTEGGFQVIIPEGGNDDV